MSFVFNSIFLLKNFGHLNASDSDKRPVEVLS